MEKESFLEKVSGSLPVSIAATAIAAVGGTAALLPLFMNTLAFGRYKKRTETAIKEIEDILKSQEDKIRNMSDSQYKITNEAILSVLQTIDEEKIRYLKRVVQNCIKDEDITPHESYLLSRIIRDISADEIMFLINHSHYSEVIIGTESSDKDSSSDSKEKVLWVSPESKDALLINGLINMGLLLIQESGWGGTMNYKFSPIVTKLISLVT